MAKILIIGAHGGTARIVTKRLLDETDNALVLFLRNADRLAQYQDNPRVTVIDGDVRNTAELETAMQGIDIVYSNVGGQDLADQTQSILTAMAHTGQKRLIFISSLGAYHEVPGKFGAWNETAIAAFLPGFRAAAKLIEAADIDYTMLRPAWMTNKDEVDYETTQKGEPFKGTEVSRQSIADLVLRLLTHPDQHLGESIGLNKPNTAGDKPAWM